MVDPGLVPMAEFERLVAEALDSLPAWIAPIVAEIAVLVEDEEDPSLAAPGTRNLGVFRGIPRTSQGGRVPGTLPDTITLYRLPILRTCKDPADVAARVLKVLGHEVGHAMGLSEAHLRELGWY